MRSGIEPRPPAPRAEALTTVLRGGGLGSIDVSRSYSACCGHSEFIIYLPNLNIYLPKFNLISWS